MTRAKMADLTQIMHLVNDAKHYMHQHNNYQWDEEYPLENVFEKDIQRGELFTYKEQNEVVCFVCINKDVPSEYKGLKWTTSPNCLVVHRMVSSIGHMRQGLARKMMLFALDRAKSTGCESIWTDTNSKNIGALKLFDSLGYHFVGMMMLRNKPDLFCCYELKL